MSDAGFKVTPQTISDAAKSCDTVAQDVSDHLASLKKYVATMEQIWHGVAQNRFQLLMQEWDTLATMLHDALVDVGSGLRGNYVNYTESEQTNINQLDNILNELGSANLN